jgi:hypothetical protein
MRQPLPAGPVYPEPAELVAIPRRCSCPLGGSGLTPASKEGQLGVLFLRVVRSLDALMGSDPELMKHWLEQPNHHQGDWLNGPRASRTPYGRTMLIL